MFIIKVYSHICAAVLLEDGPSHLYYLMKGIGQLLTLSYRFFLRKASNDRVTISSVPKVFPLGISDFLVSAKGKNYSCNGYKNTSVQQNFLTLNVY